MVGNAIAIDLAKSYDVTSADINLQNLSKLKKQKIKTVQSDLSNRKEIINIVKDFDLVIGAVPGFMGFKTLKAVIEAGKNIVDISFFSEDPFKLDSFAKEKNVTAVVDCGVAPGFSNIILGYYNKRMNIDFFKCCVGGLPFKRKMPFQYKAPFSPIDVIEEYMRPARLRENGFEVIKDALSGSELIEVGNIGTLEAFNTDGLRTLLKTMKIPTMIEKTLRYPGHIDLIKALKQAGYFNHQPIEVNGVKVKPVDLSAKLLFPLWKLGENEPEFTYMQLHIKGKEKGFKKEYLYKMFDRFDEMTKTTSMARTTGYTCNAVADLILRGLYKRKGISPPEFIGEEENCFGKIKSYLKARNIIAVKV
ncbi:MAG: saccharopine dehydrogenase [Ignavibacteria bacterium RBG_16_34_14]|nr:MAG: saccharopine dehydrogenase [Ignavibacteria bacterium RBG_16_34_14]